MSRIVTSTGTNTPGNVIFDISGSLITSKGDIPNFQRGSAAFSPYIENGTLIYKDAFAHQVRISNSGSILLEKASTNIMLDGLRISSNRWQRGSSVNVIPDIGGGMNQNYLADLLSFAAIPNRSNPATNRISQTINLIGGYTYSLSVYLNFRSGTFTDNCYLGVVINNVVVARVSLKYWFEDVYTNQNKYVPLYTTFTVSGNLVDEITTTYTGQENIYVPVRIELYCESSVTLYWGGIQLEEGPYPTSFIDLRGSSTSRAEDQLVYETSPFYGRTDFTFFIHLDRWAGDGRIFTAGNIAVDIQGGKLRVILSSLDNLQTRVIEQPHILGQNVDILFRLEAGLRAKLYIDGEVRGSVILPFRFTGILANLVIGGDGVRVFNNFFVFDLALDDRDPGMQSFAGGSVAAIFGKRLNLPLSENIGSIIFPAVTIPPRGRVSIRFPRTRYASQTISSLGQPLITNQQSLVIEVVSRNGTGPSNNQATVNFTGLANVSISYTITPSDTLEQIAAGVSALMRANPTLNSLFQIVNEVQITNIQNSGAFQVDSFSNGFNRPTTTTSTRGSTLIYITKRLAQGGSFDVQLATSPVSMVRRILVAHNQVVNYLLVPNAYDFKVGPAQIIEEYKDICDVIITDIRTEGGEDRIYCYTQPTNLLAAKVQPNIHQLFQSTWQTLIAPINYVSGHLEDYKAVQTVVKALDGFVLENTSTDSLTVSPHATVLL